MCVKHLHLSSTPTLMHTCMYEYTLCSYIYQSHRSVELYVHENGMYCTYTGALIHIYIHAYIYIYIHMYVHKYIQTNAYILDDEAFLLKWEILPLEHHLQQVQPVKCRKQLIHASAVR